MASSHDKNNALGVSCLGAGNYVRAVLLHHLQRHTSVRMRGVMDVRSWIAAHQGHALSADFYTTDPAAVVDDERTDVVLIASDHASHADYAIAALRAGKTVHLEKPPAVTAEQYERLIACLRETIQPPLHLGYNRPFAPAIVDLQSRLSALDGPTQVVCRVRGYRLSRAHWYRWPNQGSRISGNLVHWIDLGYRLSGRRVPVSVAVALPGVARDPDALTLTIRFDEGSETVIHFSSDEDEIYGMREVIEVRRQQCTAVIDDFLTLAWHDGRTHDRRTYARDKGHAANVAALAALARLSSVRSGRLQPAFASPPDGGRHIETTRALIADLQHTGAIQLAAERALQRGGGDDPVAPFVTRFAAAAGSVPPVSPRPH